jgi:antibiotic biosynthesis monooxygenase (ABM) superfamily enzyme
MPTPPTATSPGTDAVTTSVARHLTRGREREFVDWTETGMAIVGTFPVFSAAAGSDHRAIRTNTTCSTGL